MTKLVLGSAVEMKIIRENPDGSGVVEIPLSVTATFERSLTESGGEGEDRLTVEMLREMAANFDAHSRPVPVGPSPHKKFGDRSGASPAFVDEMFMRGDTLFAHVFAIAPLFAELKAGMWRGFSIEAAPDLEWPTGPVPGWSIYGGVFTNRPALPVNFRRPDAIAASVAFINSLDERQREDDMGEKNASASAEATPRAESISLEAHEHKLGAVKAELSTKQEQVESLTTRLEGVRGEANGLREQLQKVSGELDLAVAERSARDAKIQQLEVKVKTRDERVKALEAAVGKAQESEAEMKDKYLGDRIKALIVEAVDDKVPPALFDGHGNDPVAWMEAEYASFEAFERAVNRLRGVGSKLGSGKDVKSGHDPKDAPTSDKTVNLSAEDRAVVERVAGGTDFVGVTDEAEARRIWEAKQAKKKANA